MNSTRTVRTVCAALLAGTLTFTLASCTGSDGATSEPGSSVSGSAPPTPTTPTPIALVTSAPATRYKAVSKPCGVIDLAPLEAVMGKDAGEIVTQSSRGLGRVTVMRCNRSLGDFTTGGAVLIQIEILKNLPAEVQYAGLRGVEEKTTTLTDVPGLGQGAYTRVDPQTGPHLVVYDGNLYMVIAAGGRQHTGAAAQPVLDAAVQVARHTLDALRT
jgi:hypothetical protein